MPLDVVLEYLPARSPCMQPLGSPAVGLLRVGSKSRCAEGRGCGPAVQAPRQRSDRRCVDSSADSNSAPTRSAGNRRIGSDPAVGTRSWTFGPVLPGSTEQKVTGRRQLGRRGPPAISRGHPTLCVERCSNLAEPFCAQSGSQQRHVGDEPDCHRSHRDRRYSPSTTSRSSSWVAPRSPGANASTSLSPASCH